MTDYIVSGAGTTAVNGTYVENGTSLEGFPKYEKGSYTIIWNDEDEYWGILDNADTVLYAASASYPPVSPDIIFTGYSVSSGAAPAPTVTAASSGTTHEGEVALSSLSYLRTKKA